MKRVLSSMSIFVALIVMVGCGETREISEKFEISEDSLYVQCTELKGLGNLHIGKTVLKDLFTDKGVTICKESLKSNFHGGYWGVDVGNYDLGRHLDKSEQIKQVQVGRYAYPYKVGEIEFETMELAFLNDTLVGISIGGDFYKIREHMIEKFGNGKGYYSFFCKSRGKNGESNFFMEKHEHEHRIWANKNVKLEKRYDWDSKVVRNKDVYSKKGDDYCLITSQTRYDEFLQILKQNKLDYKNQKNIKIKESYNML